MKLTFTWLLFLSVFAVHAHPGTGIVRNSRGVIYYTDLKQVWKINGDGSKTVAVPDVHTHELYLDANDNLYGEHLWYNGEKLNTWGSYAWCLYSNGILDTVDGPKPGFLEEYSFVRDAAGNHYWAERFKTSRIKKKSAEGHIEIIAEGKFGDIRWMHATPGGILYFVTPDHLYKIENGQLRLITNDFAGQPSDGGQRTRHNVFGIWTDQGGNVYAAVWNKRTVKKISRDGKVTDLIRSSSPWAPTSGLFDENGNLWLMEYNDVNETRVRKITAEELKQNGDQIKSVAIKKALPLTLTAGLVLLCLIGLKKFLKS